MGVCAGLYVYDVVKKFTFAILSPDEFLFLHCDTQQLEGFKLNVCSVGWLILFVWGRAEHLHSLKVYEHYLQQLAVVISDTFYNSVRAFHHLTWYFSWSLYSNNAVSVCNFVLNNGDKTWNDASGYQRFWRERCQRRNTVHASVERGRSKGNSGLQKIPLGYVLFFWRSRKKWTQLGRAKKRRLITNFCCKQTRRSWNQINSLAKSFTHTW